MRRRPNCRRRSNDSKRPAIAVPQSGQWPSGVRRYFSMRCQSRTTSADLHDGQKVVVYSPVGGVSREMAQGLAPEPRHDRGVLAMPRSGAKAAPAATAAAIAKAGGARPAAAAKGGDKLIAARDRGKDKDRDKAADRPAEKSPPRAVSRTAASSKPAPKKK